MANYSFLFHPFVMRHDIALCNWNECGHDLESAVPQLPGIIAGIREWRAVILNTDAVGSDESLLAPDERNPFDFTAVDDNPEPHESPIPMIRLAHIIGGYAARPKCRFEEGYEYYDESAKVVRRIKLDEIDELLCPSDGSEPKFGPADFKHIYIEVPPTGDVLNKHRELSEKYSLDEARPAEILLVAMRRRSEDGDRMHISEAWTAPLEMTSSAFWERNHYPVSCRFLCTDVTIGDASKYLHDVTTFWFSVLTLTVNRIPPAYLQAYRLYTLEVDILGESIQEILNNHLDRLESVKLRLAEELAKELPPTVYKTEDILPTQTVTVAIETDDGKNMFSDVKQAGDELQRQAETQKQIANELGRDPRRAIDRAAKSLREYSMRFPGQTYELDEIQYENLRDKIDKLEKSILTTRPRNRYDGERFRQIARDVDRGLDAKASTVMEDSSKTAAFLSAAAIILISFAPYLLDAAENTNDDALIGTVILSAVMIAITCLGGYIALTLSRHKEKQIIRDVTNPLKECTQAVSTTCSEYTGYFTDICTLMKGYATLDGTKLCEDAMTRERRLLYQHTNAIAAAQKRDIEWLHAYEMNRINAKTAIKPAAEIPDTPPGESSLYTLEPSNPENDIPLNKSGERIYPPYPFIGRLRIDREEIFDNKTGDM